MTTEKAGGEQRHTKILECGISQEVKKENKSDRRVEANSV